MGLDKDLAIGQVYLRKAGVLCLGFWFVVVHGNLLKKTKNFVVLVEVLKR